VAGRIATTICALEVRAEGQSAMPTNSYAVYTTSVSSSSSSVLPRSHRVAKVPFDADDHTGCEVCTASERSRPTGPDASGGDDCTQGGGGGGVTRSSHGHQLHLHYTYTPLGMTRRCRDSRKSTFLVAYNIVDSPVLVFLVWQWHASQIAVCGLVDDAPVSTLPCGDGFLAVVFLAPQHLRAGPTTVVPALVDA
jgi:hypothetical protein